MPTRAATTVTSGADARPAARETDSVFTLPLVGRVVRRSAAKAGGVGVVQ
jgi:hypothetical protein